MFYCHSGLVKYINVKGRGQNSAQLLVTIGAKPFVVNAYPDAEPQVFSSICTLLTKAYYENTKVGISYEKSDPTDKLFEVWIPLDQKPIGKRYPEEPK